MLLSLPDRRVACKAIIFDKDGTLVDLLGVLLEIGRSRSQALREMGGQQAAEAYLRAVGADLAHGSVDRDGPLAVAPRREELIVTASALYHLGYSWDQARALAREAYDRADAMQQPPYGGHLLPGVAEALHILKSYGLYLAIATTDRGWRAEATMHALGVAACFATHVGADDVDNGKPAPDMVRLICQRLSCEPAETVVVGDSPADLQMARAAGAAAIGVTTGLNGYERLAPLADLVLPSASALPPLLRE